MRVFWILFRKELRGFVLSPLGWIVMAFVVLMHGMSVSSSLKAFSDSPMTSSLVYVSFHNPLFWFYFMFIFPLLTMRLFAEEERSGTLETLLTAPVLSVQVVLSKYMAALCFYMLLWLPSLAQFYIIPWTTQLPPAWSGGSLGGAYAILLLMGMFYLALGCWASCLTANPIIAAVLTLGMLVLQYFLGYVVAIWGENFAGAALFQYVSGQQHLHYFCKGLLDTKVLVYYLSMTLLVLHAAHQTLDYRRWRH